LPAGLGLVHGFLWFFACFSCLGTVCLFFVYFFVVIAGFSLVCFELSVPVQVIAWKDLSPN